jgi:hypothetical protein
MRRAKRYSNVNAVPIGLHWNSANCKKMMAQFKWMKIDCFCQRSVKENLTILTIFPEYCFDVQIP